jgi:hypothetical protein
MTSLDVPVCQCPLCQQGAEHPDWERHRQINLLLSRLDEPQRRWFAALEANRFGHGGDRLLSQITGLDEKTIRRGREELAAGLVDQPAKRLRRVGGGRPKVEKNAERKTSLE